jgi:hypothetical protein
VKDNLRGKLKTVATRLDADLAMPATEDEIVLTERKLGFTFPKLLREIYLISDGFVNASAHSFLPLGDEGQPEFYGGVLNVWAGYRRELESPEHARDGTIGGDCIPFFDLMDGDFLVLRKGREGVFSHYHDEGASDDPESGAPFAHLRATSFEAWFEDLHIACAEE